MKTIKVKRLQEALSVNDPEVKRRISSLLRASKAAKEAAAKAREQGKEPLADRLDKRGDELEDLANSINIDTLNGDETETHGGSRQAGQGGGGQGGHESNDSEDNDDAEDTGEDNQGSDDDLNNNIENSGQSAGERASEAANKAKQAAEEAKQAAEEAKQNAKEQGTSEAQKAAEDAESAAQEAAEAAERANQHAKAAKEAEANGDQAKAESEADKAKEAAEEAEEAAEKAEDAADSAAGSSQSEDDESNSDSSNDTDSGSNSESSDKDTKDKKSGKGSSDEDSDDNSDSIDSKGGKNSKGGKSGKPSDSSDEDGDTDDMDLADDDEDDSEDPFKDPFADEEDIPQLNIGSPNGKEPREATIKDIIKEINKLEGEAKRGAIQGLKDLISSRKPKEESLKLTEAKKGVRDMTDDEFGDLINSTWEMVKQVETDVEEIDDLEDKKAKIKAWQDDKNAIADLNQEDTMDKKKERHKIKAREKEANKYSSFRSLDDFKISFEGAIKNQIEMVLADYQTWDEINAEYESEDILMKADVQKAQLDDALPIIDIYFDQSGSWNEHHKAIGKRAIATIQKEYAEKGLCTLNIYYFDDYVTEDEHARFLGRGGTNAWPHILDNIKATGAKNVVIMTDDDMNGDAYDGPTCRVDGCVWWLWKDGRNAQECVKHLIGRAGNYQFSFKSR